MRLKLDLRPRAVVRLVACDLFRLLLHDCLPKCLWLEHAWTSGRCARSCARRQLRAKCSMSADANASTCCRVRPRRPTPASRQRARCAARSQLRTLRACKNAYGRVTRSFLGKYALHRMQASTPCRQSIDSVQSICVGSVHRLSPSGARINSMPVQPWCHANHNPAWCGCPSRGARS